MRIGLILLLLAGFAACDRAPSSPTEGGAIPTQGSPIGDTQDSAVPDPAAAQPNAPVELEEIELEQLQQVDGIDPDFHSERREQLRRGPWRPYPLGTSSE